MEILPSSLFSHRDLRALPSIPGQRRNAGNYELSWSTHRIVASAVSD
jgi:hypothetical protein